MIIWNFKMSALNYLFRFVNNYLKNYTLLFFTNKNSNIFLKLHGPKINNAEVWVTADRAIDAYTSAPGTIDSPSRYICCHLQSQCT